MKYPVIQLILSLWGYWAGRKTGQAYFNSTKRFVVLTVILVTIMAVWLLFYYS